MKLKQSDSTKFMQINIIYALYFNSELCMDIIICKKQTYKTFFFYSVKYLKKLKNEIIHFYL